MTCTYFVKTTGKVFNIEYGNIDFEKVIIESMLSKFENWKRTRNGPPMGWGGGWGGGVTADDDRGCYDPVDPV